MGPGDLQVTLRFPQGQTEKKAETGYFQLSCTKQSVNFDINIL